MKHFLLAALVTTLTVFDAPDGHKTLNQQFATKPDQRIVLQGLTGAKIKIRSWEKNEVSVSLTITFASSRSSDEQRYLDGVSLKKSESAEELSIELDEPDVRSRRGDSFFSWIAGIFGGGYMRKEISGDIFVPSTNALRAEIRYGSVSLEGMKGNLTVIGASTTIELRDCSSLQDIENNYGPTTIENSGGNLRLAAASSTISIDKFSGPVKLNADYSNFTLRDISGTLSVRSSSGTIKADRIGGDASIISNYSNITINDTQGFVDVEDQSGKIRVKNAYGVRVLGNYSTMEVDGISGKGSKDNSLTGQSGSITVSDAVGNLRVDNPYGSIDLRAIRGNVRVLCKSARIDADDISGNWTSETEFCSYAVQGLSAKEVSVTNKSGKVDLTLKSVPTSVEIWNEYADVVLGLPTGFSGEVDLNVSYGRIETNLPIPRNKSFEGGGGGYAIGKIGTGNGKMSIETKSGNIKVTQR